MYEGSIIYIYVGVKITSYIKQRRKTRALFECCVHFIFNSHVHALESFVSILLENFHMTSSFALIQQ